MPPLPMAAERTYRGVAGRTTCACAECQTNCRFMPGMLTPDDLPRLAGTADRAATVAWAMDNLLASPGAEVLCRGVRTRIRTLVPRRGPDGVACHWLTPAGRCAVHADSPAGCAFFDCRTGDDALVGMMLFDILSDRLAGGPYAAAWDALAAAGRTAPGPAECRRRRAAARHETAR